MARNNSRGGYEFEDVSSFTSNSDYKKTRKAKKGRHRGIKIFISVLCVLLIIVGGGLLYVSNYLLGGLTTNKITKDKDALGIASGVTSDPKVTNIALFGIDARGDDFTGRSDVIMICSVDEVHKKVKLTSVLRDSRVAMGDESDGYDITGTGYDKINHAYYFGGPEFAIKVLNQNFNMDIQDYVTVNFYKMAEIVDAFGGIDIEISDAELEQININIIALRNEEPESGVKDSDVMDQSGLVHLNGHQAVAYARIRDIDSDNVRAERQQIVLTAVMSKAKTMGVSEYPEMIRRISHLCETSMDFTKIMSFIPFVVGGFDVESIVIPGEYEGSDSGIMENEGWMWTYDTDIAATHIKEFVYETNGSSTEAKVGIGTKNNSGETYTEDYDSNDTENYDSDSEY